MALSDAVNKVASAPKAKTPTPAPAAAVNAPTAKGQSKSDMFRSTGQASRAKKSEADKAIEGSKSNTITFLNVLADPSRPQKRRSGKQDLPSFAVVGYSFKLGEDTNIPVAPLKAGFKSLCDCEEPTWEMHKAGETVHLNNIEMGLLIAQPQYAGEFTGGGTTVKLSIKFSSDRPDPLPVLVKDGDGSIKENMVHIAVATEVDGVKKYQLNEGMEKFAPLYMKKSAAGGRGSAGAKKTNEAHRDLAEAYLLFMQKKNK